MHNSVKFITKLEVIDSYNVLSFDKIDSNTVHIETAKNFEKIDTVGLIQVETSEKIENKICIGTTKITATICSDINIGNRKLVFRLTSADGTVSLVGSDERPYPTVTKSDNKPSSIGTAIKKALNITYTNTNSTELALI